MAGEPAPRVLLVAEPPPAYLAQPPAVVDASLICALLFDEPEAEQARAAAGGYALHAPSLIDWEVTSVAVTKMRRGAAPEAASEALADLARLALQRAEVDFTVVAALATRYALSAYDAGYLALADALRCPLLTFDRRLGEAAQRHLASLDREANDAR